MSARSSRQVFLLLCLALVGHAHSNDTTTWSIQQDRTNEFKHGLYEVQVEARKFVAAENKRLGTDWIVGEPDLRIVVPRCEVPLGVRWRTDGARGRQRSVVVCCRKADPKHDGQRRWAIDVVVFKPSEIGRAAASTPR